MTATSALEDKWFRRYGTTTRPLRRLVCLPHAGGSASFFHPWGGAFPDGTEVLVARYPGRQERIGEPCMESMESLADAVTGALLPLLDVPLALFGHSMGASLAHEVAVRLQYLHGVRLDGLYVSSRKAPHRVTPKDAYLDGDEAVLAEVRRLGGTDGGLLDDPDLRELVLPAIRSDFRIVGTYRPRAATAVDCPVTAYIGDQDADISVEDMREWSAIAPAGFDLRVLPGDHFYLIPQRDALIRDLAGRIVRAH